ncbi:MAG: hypothetical protein AB2784_16785 [Candidatus Thiodiazotropha endolucinida]
MNDKQKDITGSLLPWDEGMPTKPDVDQLLKAWPDPKVGDVFDYESISKIIEKDWKDPRFKTVTTAWRKRLQEKGLVIECKAGTAFFVASASQVCAKTYDEINSIGRKARRHRKKLVTVTPESDEERNTIVHQGRLMHEIERHSKKQRMNLLPDTRDKDIPRVEPPKSKERP